MNVDSTIRSIIEKRNKLGWSYKRLAEQSKVPHSAILRMEKGTGYWEDYALQINSILDKAIEKGIESRAVNQSLKALPVDEKRPTEKGHIIITSTDDSNNGKPLKKRSGWSLHHGQCVKCGSSNTRHIARGLCKSCYDKDIEKRHKDNERIQYYGGSSQILTAVYLIENYCNQKKSLADIAKETNCTRQYVHKKLKSYGIPLRTKSDARSIALTNDKLKFERIDEDGTSAFIVLKKVNVNEDFFSSWSSKMAYVLGVICTDGNLCPGRIREPWRAKSTSTIPRISVFQKDPELLEKVLHLMECDAKLIFHKERIYGNTKAGAGYCFHVTNEKVYDDMVNLGLTPNKSLTMQFPNMPNEFVRHFIRGCWDGDGSVYIEKIINKTGASFVSGSFDFVEAMIIHLVNAGFPSRTIHCHRHSSKSYYFKFTGSQVPMLYHYLYDDVPSTEYLQRKFDLFRLSLELNTQKIK